MSQRHILMVSGAIALLLLSGCQQQPPTATPRPPASATSNAVAAQPTATPTSPTATPTSTPTTTATQTVAPQPTATFTSTATQSMTPSSTTIMVTGSPTSQATMTRLSRTILSTPLPTPQVTITASGPLVPFSTDGIIQLLKAGPKTFGSYPVDLDPTRHQLEPFGTSITANNIEYLIIIDFEPYSQSTYDYYHVLITDLANAQNLNVGDEAAVSSSSNSFVAAMRYRNVLVRIQRQPTRRDAPDRTPLTNDQLANVLTDIYAWLKTEL